jgi:hypothetical protein
MATESTTTPEGTEPDTQGQQDEQQSTTPETGGQEQQQPSTPTEPVRLPDDHPLVKTLATQKDKLKATQTELTEARAKAAKVSQLEDELQARPSKEAVETLQTRYDRLEAFLQAAGGPISKALDSRSFTRELFESDKDVAEIASAWVKANPTATSSALASTAAEPGKGKADPNVLIRAALGR